MLWDGDKEVARVGTCAAPSAAAWDARADVPLLYVCEGGSVTLYDFQARSALGRCTPALGRALYSLSSLQPRAHVEQGGASSGPASAFVLVGGADRTVYVIDTKKWSIAERWRNALSHSITHVLTAPVALSVSNAPVVAADMDNVLVAGRAELGKRAFLSRAVGRWSGVRAAQQDEDNVVAVTDAGMLYVFGCLFKGADGHERAT